MKPDLLLVGGTTPRTLAALEDRFTVHPGREVTDWDAFLAKNGEAIVAVATNGHDGLKPDIMAKLPNLKVISCFGVGVDAIDLPAARERSVIVTNTPDILSEEVADMGLALIFMTLRGMIEADRYVREGRWPEGGPFTLGRTPRGKRLGILGLGRIGMELARRAETIGMKVSYHNRTEKPVNYPYVADLVELARQSDVLALCCPGGPATHNLVDARVLDALGPQGWLINIARGSVVDEPALIAALEGKAIAGAGIDVFADEPRVPEALRQMRNVVLQPHMASATVETRDAMAQLVVDNLEAHFAGKPVFTRVG